jgi:hypothetical protein
MVYWHSRQGGEGGALLVGVPKFPTDSRETDIAPTNYLPTLLALKKAYNFSKKQRGQARVRISVVDPDPGGQKLPTKIEKNS